MKHIWYEKWLTDNICIYFGTLSHFKLGVTIGSETTVYLGFIAFGIDI